MLSGEQLNNNQEKYVEVIQQNSEKLDQHDQKDIEQQNVDALQQQQKNQDKESTKNPEGMKKKKIIYSLLILVTIVGITLGVGLGLGLKGDDNSVFITDQQPTLFQQDKYAISFEFLTLMQSQENQTYLIQYEGTKKGKVEAYITNNKVDNYWMIDYRFVENAKFDYKIYNQTEIIYVSDITIPAKLLNYSAFYKVKVDYNYQILQSWLVDIGAEQQLQFKDLIKEITKQIIPCLKAGPYYSNENNYEATPIGKQQFKLSKNDMEDKLLLEKNILNSQQDSFFEDKSQQIVNKDTGEVIESTSQTTYWTKQNEDAEKRQLQEGQENSGNEQIINMIKNQKITTDLGLKNIQRISFEKSNNINLQQYNLIQLNQSQQSMFEDNFNFNSEQPNSNDNEQITDSSDPKLRELQAKVGSTKQISIIKINKSNNLFYQMYGNYYFDSNKLGFDMTFQDNTASKQINFVAIKPKYFSKTNKPYLELYKMTASFNDAEVQIGCWSFIYKQQINFALLNNYYNQMDNKKNFQIQIKNAITYDIKNDLIPTSFECFSSIQTEGKFKTEVITQTLNGNDKTKIYEEIIDEYHPAYKFNNYITGQCNNYFIKLTITGTLYSESGAEGNSRLHYKII